MAQDDTRWEGAPRPGSPFKNHHDDTDAEHSTEADNGPGPLFERPSAPVAAELAGGDGAEFGEQCALVLKVLSAGVCLTAVEALRLGIGHLASRISDLRLKHGYADRITKVMVPIAKANGRAARVAAYRLVDAAYVSGALEARAS